MSLQPNWDKTLSLLKSDCIAERKRGLNLLYTFDWQEKRSQLKGIFIQILKDSNHYLRIFAIDLIGRFRWGDFSPLLLSLAGDRRTAMHVREKAAWALGELRDPAAINQLAVISLEPYDSLKLYARHALSMIGSPALNHLLNFLSHTEYELRDKKSILEMIVELEMDESEKNAAFARFLDTRTDEERLVFIKAVYELKSATLTSFITERYGEQDPVRTYSLDRILSEFTGDRRRVEELINKISAADEQLALRLLVALKKFESGDASLLDRIVDAEKNTHSLGTIASLLGCLDARTALPMLANLLHHQDRRVRANAVDSISGLAGVEEDELIRLLTPLLDDFDNRVRANTARALWKVGGLQMLEVLNQMLRKGEKWMKASAAYALGEIGVYQVVEILVDALSSPDNDVKKNAIVALGKTREPEIIAPLTKIAMDQNEEFFLRRTAMEAIRRIATPQASEALLAISQRFSDDPEIHGTAGALYREICG
ncbi:MAG: HEAT repeat domain-containing protein [Candidatus Wallbacteria bacterium]|nr:HEAT repeat domain-containing protein [Candidatus Wallbacteria bacterium]